MIKRILLAGTIVGLGLAPKVYAKNVAEIPAVIIHGDYEGGSADQGGGHSHVVAKDYEHRIVTLPEVLSEQAGIHLTRYGGLEEATSISIRGSDADEVSIVLDGIPLNSATGKSVDLGLFFMAGLESIDVYRGFTPLQSGNGSAAGQISLTSKKIGKKKDSSFSFGYGSFGTATGHALFSEQRNRFGWLFSTSIASTRGNFSFLDDNGTPANADDDQNVARQNNAAITVHPLLKLSYQFDDDASIQWVNHVIRKQSGVPGLSTNQSDMADLATTEWLMNLQFKKRNFFHQNLQLENLVFTRWQKSQYSDLLSEIGLGGAQDNDDDTTLFGNKLLLEAFLGDHQVASLFFLYQLELFSPENFLVTPAAGGTSRRDQWNFGIGDEIELWDRKVVLQPMFWMENIKNRINNDDPSFTTPVPFNNTKSHHEVSAKFQATWTPIDYLSFNSHVLRGFRFPHFSELFGDQGGVLGNPQLDPQKSLNWDAGFRLGLTSDHFWLNRLVVSGSYFDRRVDDLIQFQQNAGFARAENIGRARIQGVENLLEMEFFQHALLATSYTFQAAKDQATNPGNYLPGRPEHEVNTRVEGWIKRVRLFTTIQWLDDNFLDPLNTRVVQDRILLNSGVTVEPLNKLFISFEAKNLTNDRVFDVVGFPLPGRSFFGRVTYDLF